MKFNVILFALATLVFYSCDKQEKQEKQEGREVQTEEKSEYYSLIPIPYLQNLADSSVSGDLIYNDYGISMSFPNPIAVKNSLMYIDPNKQVPVSDCGPTAHVFYNDAQGNLLSEMEIYVYSGCLHIAIVENGQILHASGLTPQGAQFYTKMVTDFKNRGQQN